MSTYSVDLEKEIEETTKRILNRENSITTESNILERKIRNYTNWAWGFVWAGIIVALIGIILFICKKPSEYNLNLLGDFLGGSVASLWSLAGLFFIYVAFLGQKQQLLNQQLEIMYSQLEVKYTRLELMGQKKEMIEQNNTLRLQKFENTFFQLLNLFNSIVNSLDLRKSNTNIEVISVGRDCFEIFYKRLQEYLGNNQGRDITIETALIAYSRLYDKYKSDISHYLRTLYHVIKFIDGSTIEDKKRYTSIVRAQLSSYEQIIIFYNCLHENGSEKFKPLVEEYAMLKNIDRSLILDGSHLSEYSEKAYGK